MLRQASSRNHRSKGFKVKNALQICLLIAICIWLLYQIKHSHEKKKAFEERNSKNLNKVIENPEDFFKLGRKGLPLIDETVSENEAHDKEDEKENENEEAQEEEPATKQQEEIEDDEGRGDGADDIDEQDQEKGEEEAENGEESPEEGDSDSHDEMDLFDNHEHEGGSQEAREENYKRDDASSAVVHDKLATESENSDGDERSMDEQVVDKADDESNDGDGSKRLDDSTTVDPKSNEDSNSDGSNHDVDPSANGSKNDADTNADSSNGEAMKENLEKKIVESENVTNGTDGGSRGDTVLKDDETLSTGNLSLNGMADNKNIEADNKDLDIEVSKPGNGSVANSTIVEDKSQMEQKDDSSVSADDIAVSNNTINSQLAQDQSMKGDGATQGEGEGEQNNSRNVETKEYSTTTSSSANENGDAGHEESENLSHATIITEEEKVDRTDLSTLPDIQSELKSTDDEAAE